MDEIPRRAAIDQAGPGGAAQAALRDARERDPDLGEQLAYLLPHLAPDLFGDFHRLIIRVPERSRESATMNALAETIGAPGRELRDRLAELTERGARAGAV